MKGGTPPCRMLPLRERKLSMGNEPIPSGILPVRLLLPKLRTWRLEQFVMVAGMFPVKELNFIYFSFPFFFIFNSNPSSSPTPFTDLRRLISHILSSFSILVSDLYRILSYNIIQFYIRNSSPNHRFRGDELLSCLKAAGVVTAVGTGVCDLKIGDVVYHHFGSQLL
uniref:Putative groES-like protein n=1 Tax=Helianthus annuus TaxID=4232 RepID=A0A251UEP3_HELAN